MVMEKEFGPAQIEEIDQREAQRHIGAASLALAGFHNRHKGIVDSSFRKAREKGEKLSGNNDKRRDYAYLSRLDNLLDKYGNRLEKKLWNASVENAIIAPDEIPDSYWKTQEQILRDNGAGRQLGNYEKAILIEDIQKQQRESLETWADYLGDENSPYPLWFKVYAWDGMTKMGVFDKKKGYFAKRDEHTVAPYPKLNPAVLAKTYGVISDFFGLGDEQQSDDNSEILGGLVKSGNFNKLYSKILLSQKAILKTPEKAEDVHGEWLEYLPGEEEKLANAAEGTPWCVADPGTGKKYLLYGGAYEPQAGVNGDGPSQAKFYLFHLLDPETNELSDTACASIRLNPQGKVAEISGLRDGQALEDSLVPTVEEKVKTLPGGEAFLEAFADKQELIRLDHKMKNGEELTKEELEFVYGINRPIKTLDTYNKRDPRIGEIREAYGIEYALNAGIDLTKLVDSLSAYDIVKNLDFLIGRGVDVNMHRLVKELRPIEVIDNYQTLVDHGANIDIKEIVSRLSSQEISRNLDMLGGLGVDIAQLIPRLDPKDIVQNFNILIKYDPDLNINKITYDLGLRYIFSNLDMLVNQGANIDILVSRFDAGTIIKHLDSFMKNGADINQIASRVYTSDIIENIDVLTGYGADIDKLVSRLSNLDILHNLDIFIDHGANIDLIAAKFSSYEIIQNLGSFIAHDADTERLLSKFSSYDVLNNIDTLLKYGIDVNQLVSKLSTFDIVDNFGTLVEHGADVGQIVDKLSSFDVAKNLDALLDYGADASQLASKLRPHDLLSSLDTLFEHGAKIDIEKVIKDCQYSHEFLTTRDVEALVRHGADINNVIQMVNIRGLIRNLQFLFDNGASVESVVSRLSPKDIEENLQILRDHGYNG